MGVDALADYGHNHEEGVVGLDAADARGSNRVGVQADGGDVVLVETTA